MLIQQYRTELVRPPNPLAPHLRCYAHLDADIREVLPYLNTVLKGHQYFHDPPSLTLKYQAKLITLHSRMIAINIVKDETEAHDILEWLKGEINDTWERRKDITPSFQVLSKPRILEILKLLPKTNCRQCGLPTCMVFATQVSEGNKGPDDCPPLERPSKRKLQEYLKHPRF
jgi:ArsR family metal-binding transcriptional regulator